MTTMTTDTPARTVTFVEPLPGFDQEDDFTLDPIDSAGVLHSLRSVRNPQLRFVLSDPATFFSDYRPGLPPAVSAALGGDDVDLLVMLTIGSGLADATANLRAPIA